MFIPAFELFKMTKHQKIKFLRINYFLIVSIKSSSFSQEKVIELLINFKNY